MQKVLKLTITAVGEPDSVFLVPCDPITLHESKVESAGDDEAQDSVFESLPDENAALASPEVMIVADEPPRRAHRRSSDKWAS